GDQRAAAKAPGPAKRTREGRALAIRSTRLVRPSPVTTATRSPPGAAVAERRCEPGGGVHVHTGRPRPSNSSTRLFRVTSRFGPVHCKEVTTALREAVEPPLREVAKPPRGEVVLTPSGGPAWRPGAVLKIRWPESAARATTAPPAVA